MNICILSGNLTDNPELRTVKCNNADVNVTTFTIGVDDGYGDKKKTQFVRVVAWRGLGDVCNKYLTKGQAVTVRGSIRIDNYLNSYNQPRSVLEIKAEDVEFGSKPKEQAPTPVNEPDCPFVD